MSGIEVAGIALAVFPVLVNGITGYAAGARTFKYWRRCRAQLEDYAYNIKVQKIYYLDTLEGLLIDIVESEDDLESLMSDPGGAAWQRAEYDQLLRRRLDRSYDVYLRTLRDMVNALRTLGEKLGISPSGKVLMDDQSFVAKEMKRLQISLLKDVYKELLNTVEESNRKLRDITHQNVYLEPLRKERKSKHPTANLRIIRKHAASLHRALITSKAWKCPCRQYHLASLRLESRSHGLRKKDAAISCSEFRVLLSTLQNAPCSTRMSQWQAIEIRPSIDVVRKDASRVSPGPPRKSVRFPTELMQRTTINAESNRMGPSTSPATCIADICSTIYGSARTDKPMGFLADDTNPNHKHYLSRADTNLADEPRSETLAERLTSACDSSPFGSVSRKDRLEIAVTLASSVLQLDGTSWLTPHWSSSDIYFHQELINQPASIAPQPYLPWRPCTTDDNLHSFPCTTFDNEFVRSAVLFALGLTLVELCFGKTLRNLRKPEDEARDQSETAQNTHCAFRLLDGGWIMKEMGDTYEDVVRRCLRQLFDVRDLDLDREEVQQQVYQTVVVPLIESLDNLLGLARIN